MSGTTFSKLPVMIVALVIGLILTFTAVMPLVSDYADAKTFKNDEGILGYLIPIDNTTEYTMTWDVTTPDVAVVNGDSINLYPGSVICGGSPDFIIRYWSGSTQYMQGRDSDTHNFTANSTLSISIASGIVTVVSDTDTTTTYSVDSGFAISKTGSYVMKSPTQKAYMNGDSEFYAYGVSGTDGSSLWMKITGSIEDGAIPERISGQAGTFSDVNIVDAEVDGYIDLYLLEKITLVFTNTNTNVDTNLTYNFFIVPYEVTADPDNPTVYKNLVSVLPLFALILLVAGAASLIYFKNKD